MIYLDANATTRPYKEVVYVMADVAYSNWGNPSSPYALGDNAKQLIEGVREQIAEDINAKPSEIIFTSGACEANSLAIAGFLGTYPDYQFITTSMEHSSITHICEAYNHQIVKNNKYGFVSNPSLLQRLSHNYWNNWKRCLVSIIGANNEFGTIQDLRYLADIVHRYGGVFHSDCTQLYAQQKIDVRELGLDMMSVSAQKFHGPRGMGFLFVRDGIKLSPIIYGSQESELRGGTYNTAGIVGMGKALELTRLRNASETVEQLRNKLLSKLLQITGVRLNGAYTGTQRLVNNINVTITGVKAETLVTMCSLYGLYISAGSACNSGNPEPSRALKALGLTDEQCFNTIRISLDEFTTEEEVDQAADIITKLVERIRNEE